MPRLREPRRGAWTCRPATACSTSPAAAATPRSPPARRTWGDVVGARLRPQRCSSAVASAPPPRGWRSSSSRETPRTFPSRTAASTRCSRSSARCSPPTRRRRPRELLRVCKPGGRIGMGNWTPDGFVGDDVQDHRQARAAPAGADAAGRLGHRGAAAGAVRRRDLGPPHTSAGCSASPSAPSTTSSSSSASSSGRPRWPSSGSARRARRRSRTTLAR